MTNTVPIMNVVLMETKRTAQSISNSTLDDAKLLVSLF